MRSIDKLLVANRGEIALRVMRTCRAMGITTVAVYADPDADAPFVRFADEAVRIGPAPAHDSYLAINAVLDAARITGAHAIHPGYGFLSENARFSEAVADAGLVFIGPPAAVIEQLGSKQAAKRIAAAAGVPTVPGYSGDDQATAAFVAAAAALGYPLLVKASAGCGGKGMRLVRQPDELAEAIDRARGEAGSAFGDATLLLEKYVDRPRHIEIQILGDSYGHVVHLWERECSIQRRHQKVLEEAPSPALDPARRAAMGKAAVELGRAVGYVGAGTVEFIVDPGHAFYFLEVNTRLQVEHPVTELTTGLDLVREQIRIARGEPLGYDAAPPQRGWAIEVRLCAEDPERDYLPTTGTLLAAEVPVHGGAAGGVTGGVAGGGSTATTLRADLGIAAGSEIGIHYDSMLGKIISHAPTRREAAQVLRRALEQTWVPGLVTNRAHLIKLLAHPAFLAGELDTHFLERHAGELAARAPGLDQIRVAAVGLVLHGIAERRAGLAAPPLTAPGWRNVRFADQQVTYKLGDADVIVGYRPGHGHGHEHGHGDGELVLAIGGKPTRISRFGVDGDRVWFVEHAGHRRAVRVARAGARAWVLSEGQLLAFVEQPRFAEPGAGAVAGSLTAPMPGKVVKVLVTEGQVVAAHAPLIVLEAMKMEHTMRAPAAGTVRAVHVAVGDQVDTDRVLAIVTA
ncbi:MAG TPA: biotin carboxylase N-terminal domain-containing protein [Kofleriaceae bacterium]|nr:biotin carboxylase N-terminal domain-containing protein [Kofleriaceae bacterium]